jgi:5-methylcytosine-specific restriction endonuclease McrA
MNNKLNAAQVWKDFEDLLAPRLSLSTTERVVYSHLLRHSSLEGKVRFQFSIPWLARGSGLSQGGAKEAVRRLVSRGVLRVIECNSEHGHVVTVRLPEEIRGVRIAKSEGTKPAGASHNANLEEMDFLQTRKLRSALHTREGGQCFYCLRRLICQKRCLDHVVPRAQSGNNSYRNLVSCCRECNSNKGVRPAEEFLRWLYRERRLSAIDLTTRLRALDDLAAGKLKPQIEASPQQAK